MEMNDNFLDDKIRRQIKSLDNTYPDNLPHPDKLWEKMLQNRKQQHSFRLRIIWSIAASLLLLVLAVFPWLKSLQENPVESKPTQNELASIEEGHALEYINALCRTNKIPCTSPAFKELKNELLDASFKLTEVNKQLTLFGNDDNLLRAKTRIENHQARIIQAMVQSL
jgi:hypothetical protein